MRSFQVLSGEENLDQFKPVVRIIFSLPVTGFKSRQMMHIQPLRQRGSLLKHLRMTPLIIKKGHKEGMVPLLALKIFV